LLVFETSLEGYRAKMHRILARNQAAFQQHLARPSPALRPDNEESQEEDEGEARMRRKARRRRARTKRTWRTRFVCPLYRISKIRRDVPRRNDVRREIRCFLQEFDLEKAMLSEIDDSVLSKHKSFACPIGLDLIKDLVMAAGESAREQQRKQDEHTKMPQ
jgi:hypothetical protein